MSINTATLYSSMSLIYTQRQKLSTAKLFSQIKKRSIHSRNYCDIYDFRYTRNVENMQKLFGKYELIVQDCE